MIRCSCGEALVSVEAICERCLPNGLPRWPRFRAGDDCPRCGQWVDQPAPGRSTRTCACGCVLGLDFFRS